MYDNPQTDIRFCLYVRKSSERIDRQILSIESQVRELKSLAVARGIRIIKVFEDSASAHKRNNRPAFDQMLDAIERREIDGVLTWKADRLSRNLPEGGILIHMLQQGILKAIVTPSNQFLPSDNMLMLTIEMGMANQYSLDLSRNIKRGNKTKIEQGGFCSLAPIGYLNDKVSKTIIPDPDRFDKVQQLFQKYLKGEERIKSICAIAKSWGLKTKKGNNLAPSTFYRMLTNAFYYGKIRQGGHESTGIHQPMISKADFNQIKVLLTSQKRKRVDTRYKFPYTGLMTCGECSRGITAQEKYRYNCPKCNTKRSAKKPMACKCGYEISVKDIKNAKHYYYYNCTSGSSCRQGYLSMAKLEAQLVKHVHKFDVNEEFSHWASRWLDFVQNTIEQEGKIEKSDVQKSISALQKKISRLTDLRMDGELNKEEFLMRKNEITSEIENLESNSDTEGGLTEELKIAFQFLVGLKHFFQKGDTKSKDRIIRKIVSNPIIIDGKLHVQAQKPYLYLPDLKRLHKGGIEPPKSLSAKGLEGVLERCYSIWWSTINANRNQ